MNAARQILHVARKDSMMARWFLLGFVAVTVVAGVQSADLFDLHLPLSGWFGVIVFLLGVYVTGHIVQADSPIRSNAFWATRPLMPAAVFSAKLLILGLLLVVVGAMHSFALITHAVPRGDVASLLANALIAQGVVFAVALLAAATTQDTRTFILTLVLGMIAWLMLLGVMSTWQFAHGDNAQPALPFTIPSWFGRAAFVVGAIALVAYQYKTGKRRMTIALAIPLVLLMAAARLTQPMQTGLGFSTRSLEGAEARAAETSTGITFRFDPAERGPEGEIGLFGRVNGPPQNRMYVLNNGVVDLRGADGRTQAITLVMPILPLNRASLPAVPGTRWLRHYDEMFKSEVSLRLTVSQPLTNVLRDAVPVAVRGQIEEWTPRLAGRLPLTPGAELAFRGTRVRILEVRNGLRGPEIKLKVSRIRRTRGQAYELASLVGAFGSSEYAILDRKNGVARQMRSARSTGSSMGLVVALPDATQSVVDLLPVPLSPQEGDPASTTADMALLIFDWQPDDRRPIEVQVTTKH